MMRREDAREPFLEERRSVERRFCTTGPCCYTGAVCCVLFLLPTCYGGLLAWRIQHSEAEPLKLDSLRPSAGLDSCTHDTGGSCYLFGCEDWRNAQCVHGQCLCRSDQCSVGGECVPERWTKQSPAGFGKAPVKGRGNFTALVLSGGGAKGAFELGVLEGICRNNSLAHLRNWSMIVGTSIGALNAGALAQFSPEAQCDQALAAAQSFWDSIKASEDVWVSSNLADPATDPEKNRAPCMVPSRLMSMALAFWQRGGLCDPTPGRRNFELGVRRERIRSSGMMLRVVATSLKTGQAKWWDEKSDRIIEGCEASGAIAPIIYPMEVDSEGFVDGGFVANTPIMKALEDGAQTVVVVNLDPVNTTGLIPDLEALSKAGIDVGLSIVEFEFNMMQQRYFLEHELQMACFGFPDRRILAFTPRTDPGNFLSFSGKALQRMREQGIETVRASAPVDLCKSFFRPAHRGQMNVDLPPHPVAVETFLATNVTPMDLRFALLCFMLGLTSGLALRRVACGRFQPVTDVALDV